MVKSEYLWARGDGAARTCPLPARRLLRADGKRAGEVRLNREPARHLAWRLPKLLGGSDGLECRGEHVPRRFSARPIYGWRLVAGLISKLCLCCGFDVTAEGGFSSLYY